MYARIATSTGWRYQDIDELTFNEVNELAAYWKDMPPTHVGVARLVHILEAVYLDKSETGGTPTKATGSSTPDQPQTGDLTELFAMFPNGVISGKGF